MVDCCKILIPWHLLPKPFLIFLQNRCYIEDSDSDEDDELDGGRNFPTIMVPMADLLNHVPNHNAELNLGESAFRMIAVRDIEKVSQLPCIHSLHCGVSYPLWPSSTKRHLC